MKNYYKIMGVKMDATDDEIKQSYRQLAKRYHPDLHPNDSEIAARFADINEANETLSDKARRAEYDKLVQEALQRRAAQQGQGTTGQGVPNYANAQNAHANASYGGQSANFAQPPYGAQQGHTSNQNPFASAYQQSYEQAYRMANDAQKIGYQRGYTQGATDAGKRAEEQIEGYKRTLAVMDERVKTAEEQVRTAREQAQKARQSAQEAAAAAESNNKRGDKNTANKEAEKRFEREIEALSSQVDSLIAQLETERNAREKAEDALLKQADELGNLRAEADEARAQLYEWETYGRAEDDAARLKAQVEEWNQKKKDDKKWLKNTLYGTLNVMFWETPSGLSSAFEKLKRRFAKKVLAGDAKYKQKLRDAADAHKTLSDRILREKYNATLEITEAEVEECRNLEREYKIALEQLKSKDQDEVFAVWLDDLTAAAEDGDAESANALGELYLTGDGVEADDETAAVWFKVAAEGGNPEGMYNYGLCLLNGEGVKCDALKGVEMIKQSAAEGCTAATEFLQQTADTSAAQ